jgi:phospholipase/carboxylesterase
MTKYPELAPLFGTTRNLVVFLHGYGSDGHDMIGLAPYMQKSLPNTHFFSPHGIEQFPGYSIGRQWFDLSDRSQSAIQAELERVSEPVMEIILDKARELNMSTKDVILVGFSQGSMLSLYLNMSQYVQNKYAILGNVFGGVVAFSGRFIPPVFIPNISPIVPSPICLIHGSDDEVIGIEEMDDAYNSLKSYGGYVECHHIPNLAHSIDASGIGYAVQFINNIPKILHPY